MFVLLNYADPSTPARPGDPNYLLIAMSNVQQLGGKNIPTTLRKVHVFYINFHAWFTE